MVINNYRNDFFFHVEELNFYYAVRCWLPEGKVNIYKMPNYIDVAFLPDDRAVSRGELIHETAIDDFDDEPFTALTAKFILKKYLLNP